MISAPITPPSKTADYKSAVLEIEDLLHEIRKAPRLELLRVMEIQGRLMHAQRRRMAIFEAMTPAERGSVV